MLINGKAVISKSISKNFGGVLMDLLPKEGNFKNKNDNFKFNFEN
jgi:hypothetical protein